MNLFKRNDKARAALATREFPITLPLLKTEYDRTRLYLVPRVRERTSGRIMHLDNAAERYTHVVLTGPPGIGKSAALRFLAARCRHAVALEFSFADFHPDARRGSFPDAAWILYDDVSHPAHVAHLHALAKEFPNAHIWAAGRDAHLVPEGFTCLELSALNEREIASFAAAWFPFPSARGHATRHANPALDEFIASLNADPGTRELATNPLDLFLLIQVYATQSLHAAQQDALGDRSGADAAVSAAGVRVPVADTAASDHVRVTPLPTRRALLFDAYLKAALAGERDPDFALRALEGIALATKRGQRAREEHLTRGYGLLEERANGRIAFKHSLFQDFLAARALRRNPDFTPLREHLHEPSWYQVVLFYAGLGDPTAVVQAWVERGAWEHAAWALAQSVAPPPEWIAQVTQMLIQRAWEEGDETAADALGALHSLVATDFFATKLRDNDPAVRRRAATLLGRLRTERAIEYLLPQLRDPNPDVRDTVIAALGQSRSERVIEPLLVALRGDPRAGVVDTRLRLAAAHALGEIGADKAVPALIVDLELGEPPVRAEAALALAKIRSEFAIKPLQHLATTHPKPEVRAAAAQVLAAMQGQ